MYSGMPAMPTLTNMLHFSLSLFKQCTVIVYSVQLLYKYIVYKGSVIVYSVQGISYCIQCKRDQLLYSMYKGSIIVYSVQGISFFIQCTGDQLLYTVYT